MATYVPQKTDDAAFTVATDTVVPMGALADQTSPDNVDEGDVGIPRMSLKRCLLVEGDIAADDADAGSPVKIGAVARTANPTAVAGGDRVNLSADDLGRLITVPHQARDLTIHQQTTITSSATETECLAAGAAGVFHDIVAIVITNSSATATEVTFKDLTTGGTTRLVVSAPANDTRGVVFQVPLTQSTAANKWTATCADAVASIYITVQAVLNN